MPLGRRKNNDFTSVEYNSKNKVNFCIKENNWKQAERVSVTMIGFLEGLLIMQKNEVIIYFRGE